MKKYNIGSVHGRFQLFHNEHLHYILSSLEKCNFLMIGITSYINTELIVVNSAKHRSVLLNNPFTYYERTQIITTALNDLGISSEKYFFSPFPIEQPKLLSQFMSYDIKCFTTIYDEWNKEKVAILKNHGYDVEILWEKDIKDKNIVGTDLRNKILNCDESWKESVPPATINAVKKLNIIKRLKQSI